MIRNPLNSSDISKHSFLTRLVELDVRHECFKLCVEPLIALLHQIGEGLHDARVRQISPKPKRDSLTRPEDGIFVLPLK